MFSIQIFNGNNLKSKLDNSFNKLLTRKIWFSFAKRVSSDIKFLWKEILKFAAKSTTSFDTLYDFFSSSIDSNSK